MLVFGQQQMQVVSMFDKGIVFLNPGATGNKEALAANFLFRKNWLNIAGSPLYSAFTAHAPLKDPKIAMGVHIEYQKDGITNMTGVYVNYAYRIPMGPGKLSLGLKFGVNTGSKDEVEVPDPGDPYFTKPNLKYFIPNAGFGAYYTNPKFWAGLSIPRLLYATPNSSYEYQIGYDIKQFEYYFTGGTKIPVNNDIAVEPSALILLSKYSTGFEINALATYKSNYKGGLGFRSMDSALIIILGYRLNNQFTLGYSYDLNLGLNKTWRSSFGSHEINVSYKFGYTVNASSPRRF